MKTHKFSRYFAEAIPIMAFNIVYFLLAEEFTASRWIGWACLHVSYIAFVLVLRGIGSEDRKAVFGYPKAGVSFALLLAAAAAFAMIFRRRFLRLALPLAMSVGAALCAQALFAGGVNLFHILALFILMGLGVDYAIFHSASSSNGTKNAVLISFATSFAGFGALAFTSFGAISSIGSVLAVGLAAAYLTSFLGAENG